MFRPPTPVEAATAAACLGEPPRALVAFDADVGGTCPAACLIAADHVRVERVTVYRYWRTGLAPGERLAPWVRALALTRRGRARDRVRRARPGRARARHQRGPGQDLRTGYRAPYTP
ncbi:hypothetical protein ACFU5O_26500 [Streptomyces sp. NPDC057445]|uniref:hypothetical protein n=1 Tax=Streptomyces sp. NPDC057445 TaxID=3346136 RepID=UPI003697D7C3